MDRLRSTAGVQAENRAARRTCPVSWKARWPWLVVVLLVISGGVGCGTTKTSTATEQLLMSDAVDATVAQIDFSPLSGHRVFLDTNYLKSIKSPLLIDSAYVISSLRQQMVASGVLLVDSESEADIIAEARLGALGFDGHNVTYGIPQTNALSNASKVLSGQPILPTLPEVALAKKEAKVGAAKVSVFAYRRDDRAPVWQSGIARSSSEAQDIWILGMGPLQKGTVYDQTRLAGSALVTTDLLPGDNEASQDIRESEAFAAYVNSRIFPQPEPEDAAEQSEVVTASADKSASEKSAKR
ncbi:MAG: hypothetical protein D6753_12285 [Planctomycetota bacterium]|nr:MAG: hypothetical protein D6753_12285 [Planctomycetota bacterium]